MNTVVQFHRFQIAPCAINCGTCRAYLREKNKCPGCMSSSGPALNSCLRCPIRNCESLKKTTSKFCSECISFPCQRIKHIDKRYRTKYKTGLIENLRTINASGIEDYLRKEASRWTCSGCGSVLSVHSGNCLKCGKEYIDPYFKEIDLLTS
jgi:hypothetical protein